MQSNKDTDFSASFSSQLDYNTNSSSHVAGRKKRIALVAQGGGQRGIFTAGVLDSFLDADFDPFELFIGTSAGALNLSAFITRQRGFGHRFVTDITTDDRFFNLLKYVKRQQFMNLDWALETSGPEHLAGLRIDKAQDALQSRSAFACATNVRSLEPEYFPLFEGDWLSVMKATCAIPLLYPSAVDIGGQHYVDGGVSGAIPAREAFNRGADIIVVIRTEPAEVEHPHISSTLLENLKNRMEDQLPKYAARFHIEDGLEKMFNFQQQISTKFSELKFLYAESHHENLWLKLKDIVPKSMHRNGERWLLNGNSIYRLHTLSGKKLNADMLGMLTKHYHSYQEAIDFMATPPVRTQLIQIAPTVPLNSSALLSKPHQLEHDYQQGLEIGRQFMVLHAKSLQDQSTFVTLSTL